MLAVDKNKKETARKAAGRKVFRIVRICFAVVFCLAGIAAICFIAAGDKYTGPVFKDITIEAGESFKLEDFIVYTPSEARFITDVSGIDTKIPAVYGLKVGYDKFFEHTVRLTIVDTTAPTGKAEPQYFFTVDRFPDVRDCVKDLYDLNGIKSVEFKSVPDVSEGGEFNVPVIVTDAYDNTTVIDVPMHVTKDVTPPEIKGLQNNRMIRSGDKVDFKEGIEVTDDFDKNPSLSIDASKFNSNKPGKYTVTYKAMDRSGNVTEKKVKLEVWQSSAGDLKKKSKQVYKYADKILKGIKGKNDVDRAKKIYKWVCKHIVYLTRAGHPTFEKAALSGFKNRKGNCWVMCSVYKVLLDRANIPNLIVTRANCKVSTSNHYWNLIYVDKGWYHCDCTPLYPFFMKIDSQLDQLHTFNHKLYPKRATKKAKSTKGYYAKKTDH